MKYKIISVFLFLTFFTFPSIACTNTQVTICWYQDSSSAGFKACWVKNSGFSEFKVADVGVHFYDQPSSLTVSPSQSGSVITYCESPNFVNCTTLPTANYSWFTPTHNDKMESWKFSCSP